MEEAAMQDSLLHAGSLRVMAGSGAACNLPQGASMSQNASSAHEEKEEEEMVEFDKDFPATTIIQSTNLWRDTAQWFPPICAIGYFKTYAAIIAWEHQSPTPYGAGRMEIGWRWWNKTIAKRNRMIIEKLLYIFDFALDDFVWFSIF